MSRLLRVNVLRHKYDKASTNHSPFRFAKVFHSPGSNGTLNLPFQRPIEACRKFISPAVENVISNITSKVCVMHL